MRFLLFVIFPITCFFSFTFGSEQGLPVAPAIPQVPKATKLDQVILEPLVDRRKPAPVANKDIEKQNSVSLRYHYDSCGRLAKIETIQGNNKVESTYQIETSDD